MISRILLIPTLLLTSMLGCYAQVNNAAEQKKYEYQEVDQVPVFPGGEGELKKFISSQIKYSESAAKSKKAGVVFVAFTIETDGSVCDPEVVRGIDPALDAEAVRVIQYLPNWQAGRNKGIPVAVWHALPVKFILPASPKK